MTIIKENKFHHDYEKLLKTRQISCPVPLKIQKQG